MSRVCKITTDSFTIWITLWSTRYLGSNAVPVLFLILLVLFLGWWPCHTWCHHHLLPDPFLFGCHAVFLHRLSRVSATPAPSACLVALQHIYNTLGYVLTYLPVDHFQTQSKMVTLGHWPYIIYICSYWDYIIPLQISVM